MILDQCSELITPSLKPSQNQTIPSILYAVTEQQQSSKLSELRVADDCISMKLSVLLIKFFNF